MSRGCLKELFHPIKANIRGSIGESRVNAKLNPLFFGKVEHRQINNLILVDKNGGSHQIDHVEIRENGIFCIETKNYKGIIKGDENSQYWTQCLYRHERHQMYNPIKQNKTHCLYVSKALDNKYKIVSVIVMAENNANTIPCNNVINLKDLQFFLSDYDNGTHLSIQEMDDIYTKLMYKSSNMTNREHVENIRNTQEQIENNICPRCKGKLVRRKGKHGYFYGCSNYPKCKFIRKY